MTKEIVDGIEETYWEEGTDRMYGFAAPCPICKEWINEDTIVCRCDCITARNRKEARRMLLQKYAEHVLSHYNYQTKLWSGEHMFTQQVRVPSIYIVPPNSLPFWQRVKYLLKGEI